MTVIVPIILCGGSGTRLWPLSRFNYPKQFLSLVTEQSLLQDTVNRLPLNCLAPILICNEDHRFIVAEQMRALNKTATILLEPEGRNTAPAITLGALQAIKENPEAMLLVLASDHVIEDTNIFHQTVQQAEMEAESNKLVTFGISPTTPETAYGYIKKGCKLNAYSYEVEEFVEKPNKKIAQIFLDKGEYLWNSGMFMFKATHYLRELKKYSPNTLNACENAMNQLKNDLDFLRIDKKAFLACENESIDNAIMEKAENVVVIPIKAGWSDIGSYQALANNAKHDDNQNVIKGDVIAIDTHNCYVHSTNKLVATLGVDNLIVVDTPDAVLIADKNKAQEIKKITKALKDDNRNENSLNNLVYRPWGKYNVVDRGNGFQVKKITINPGKKLSVQMHHHRAEHWIIVSGCAKVMIDKKVTLRTENQSAYIPAGVIHSLENPGKLLLELIEVQSGSYLEEDDIVRFEDTNFS